MRLTKWGDFMYYLLPLVSCLSQWWILNYFQKHLALHTGEEEDEYL
jgi:hypothetical protein